MVTAAQTSQIGVLIYYIFTTIVLIVAVAIAIVLSRVVKVGLLTYFVCRRGGVSLARLELKELYKLLPGTAVVAVLALGIRSQLVLPFGDSLLARCGLLAIAGGVGAGAYLASALFFGSQECRYLANRIRRRAV